jgi:phage tail-like protein
MAIPESRGQLPFAGNPPLAFRFGVFFFAGGVVPNPVDILFQKVSGIGSKVNTVPVEEGGQNLYTQSLPEKIQHDNLVLERGLVIFSPLSIEFNLAMSGFQFAPSNVLVNLLNDTGLPVAAWLFLNAYPVKWSVSDLDADNNAVVVEHLELSYQHMLSITI